MGIYRCRHDSGLNAKDLEPYIESRARVAEVLNRRRTLTIEMKRKLHAGLGSPWKFESGPTLSEAPPVRNRSTS